MNDDGNGSRVSHAMTTSFWFKIFMQGCHRCMGDVWLPDKAVSSYVIDGCLCLLERDWNDIWEQDKEGLYGLRLMATATCVIIERSFRGLGEEEINKIDISVTRKH